MTAKTKKITKKKSPQKGMMIKHSMWSGPLPPPSILEQYNQAVPNGAERVFKMAETQSKHRQKIETKVINSGALDSRLGLIFALFIGLGGFILAGWTAFLGYEILSGSIVVIDLGGLVSTFIYGSKTRKDERVEKERMAPRLVSKSK